MDNNKADAMKINKHIINLLSAIALAGPGFPVAMAEVYIYVGLNGERMISDKPQSAQGAEYELLTRRDSLNNAGHILAKRRIDTGSIADYRHYITAASKQYRIDPDLVEAIIQVESGFNSQAVSRKGATGLMQLMWPTAQRYQVRDRFNPRENIYAGVRHLRDLMEQFDGKTQLVLAAYNAGAGAVERYRGVPPFPETERYITKVLEYQHNLKRLYAPATYSD
ncbi:MAG: lytic transglycosylase domain-containing protein [Pseudomonadales bacterium]